MNLFDIDWNDPNLLIGDGDLPPEEKTLNLSYSDYVLLLARLPEIAGRGEIASIETPKLSGIPRQNRLCEIESLYLYLSLWLQCLTLSKPEIYSDLISSEESRSVYPYADLSLARMDYCKQAWMRIPVIHEGFLSWETLWFAWELSACRQRLKIAGLIWESQQFDRNLMLKSSQTESSSKVIKICKQILRQKNLAAARSFFAPKGDCFEDGQMGLTFLGKGVITSIQESDKFLESHCHSFLAALKRFNLAMASPQYQVAAALPGGKEYVSGSKRKPPGFGIKKDNGRPTGNLKLGGTRRGYREAIEQANVNLCK